MIPVLDVASGAAELRVTARPPVAVGVGGAAVVVAGSRPTVMLRAVQQTVTLTAPAGPSPPPIHVGPTPPADPEVNALWVDTS